MPAISRRKSSEVSVKRLVDDVEVNDEEWHCLVTMLIETRQSQTSYTLLLNEVCEAGRRKAVRLISREEMMTRLRHPVKGESSYAVHQSPSVQRIRECIKSSLGGASSDTAGASADNGLLAEAALIKWMIYEVRLEWLARRAAEREEPQPKSKLRRRGEEWRDRVYVDDAPDNGPDLYILLTGFRDSKLPLELIAKRVPLNCILRLDDFHFDEAGGDSSLSGCGCTRSDDCQSSDQTDDNDDDEPLDFWLYFDKSQCPELAVRAFCPPNNPDDLYDRISYVLYDSHELSRAHAAYLCAMKVIHVYESRSEKQMASAVAAYETHLSSSGPTANVDIIVEAMLGQVEKTLALGADDFFAGEAAAEQTQDDDEEEEEEEDESSRQTSLSGVNSAVAFARLTEKLGLLNLKYELISDRAELILRRGDLLNVRRANDRACDLKDLPRIAEARCRRDLDEVETCRLHLPGVLRCAEEEGIKGYKAKHLLNILGLRDIIHSTAVSQESSTTSGSSSVRDKYIVVKLDDKVEKSDYENGKMAARRRHQSEVGSSQQPCLQNFSFKTKQVYKVGKSNNISGENLETPSSSNGNASNENASSESSLNLDCNQVITKRKLANSNESVERESGSTPSSDSSCRCVEPRVARSTKLPGEAPRRLSSLEATSLLRSFEKCAPLFGLIDARESLGLATSSPTAAGGYPPLEFAELLPNPWTLLDCFNTYAFSSVRYFAPTDSILALFYDERPGRVAERRLTCALRTALCLRDFCEYVVDEERDWLQRRTATAAVANERQVDEEDRVAVFKDEDFLLPGSIKAMELMKLKSEEMCNGSKRESAVKNGLAAAAEASKSSSGSLKNNGATVEPRRVEFIGYDLGAGRVQVTNLTSSYEASDGTRLRLTRDTWLLDAKQTTTTTTSLEVEVPDCCSLRYHEVSDADEGLFHLTTENGIIAAFAFRKPLLSDDNANRTNELTYELQISWPSGLIVKPVEYPDADYPFYVLQYYSFKDFECEAIRDESHRKYLHNGDVVKFFNDGSIVVLRPNGIVITLGGRSHQEDEASDGRSTSSWDKSCNCVNDKFGLPRETSILLEQYSPEWEETEELRYAVLELDGRRYEVVDGRIVRELDRLRANIAEEYSAEEKFARRADGTDALFTSDAELIVSFPDGTRTLSSCIIDDTEDEEAGFVLVSLRNRAEHPKYASVAGHRLSMHQLEFRLDDGQLELACGNEVRVEASSESASISRGECLCPTSQVSFDLTRREPQLARLRDKASRRLLTVWREDARLELTPETCSRVDEKTDDRESRVRMFAVARDGSTREYLHRSIWQRRFLDEMLADHERACLIRSRDDGVESFLGLVPANEWTVEYKIRKAKPSVVDEEEREIELAFKATATPTSTRQQQRFLRARLVEGIATSDDGGENSLISMQRALLRYWREVATGRGKAFETAGTAITCDCRGEIESWMRDVALGRVGTIDRESYEAGRQELKKLRAEQDEERTREMIDRAYARANSSSVPETNVLGSDNE